MAITQVTYRDIVENETGHFVGSGHIEYFAKECGSIFLCSGETQNSSELSSGIHLPMEITLAKIMKKRKTIKSFGNTLGKS